MTALRRALKDRPFVTTHSKISPRPMALRVVGGLFAAAFMLLAAPHPASAQGKLEAHYEATLAGIPVGRGAWTIEIADDQFTASAFGGTAGLLKAFAGGTGTGASQGRIINGALVPTNYSATTTTSKKSEAIRMVLTGGNVREYAIEPEPPVDPNRHSLDRRASPRRLRSDDRIDAAGAGHIRSAQPRRLPHGSCDLRWPHALRSQARLQAHGNREGREGLSWPRGGVLNLLPPVAGYIPDRPVIKYLAAQRNMEIAFVPVAGTRILVPFRLVIPTPFGTAMLEATQFITPGHAPARGEDAMR